MPIQPAIPLSGYGGWKLLQRTLDRQTETFSESADLKRNLAYFRENIGDITTVEEFVADRRIMTVALGAYGLGEEVDKRAYVRKILEEGTINSDAFAIRLNNSDYIAFARTFSFGDGGFLSSDSLIQDIENRYIDREFERAVGNVDNDIRLSLNYQRRIADTIEGASTDEIAWFRIMGSQPIREIMQTALNLPSETVGLDVDRQQEIFAEKAKDIFGISSPSELTEPDKIEEIIRTYQLRRQATQGPQFTTPGYSALTLLQTNGFGAAAQINLILSNS